LFLRQFTRDNGNKYDVVNSENDLHKSKCEQGDPGIKLKEYIHIYENSGDLLLAIKVVKISKANKIYSEEH